MKLNLKGASNIDCLIFFLHSHQDSFTGVVLQKCFQLLKNVPKHDVQKYHPMMNGKTVLNVSTTNIQHTDTCSQLRLQGEGLALCNCATMTSGQRLVCPREREGREGDVVRQRGHPFRIFTRNLTFVRVPTRPMTICDLEMEQASQVKNGTPRKWRTRVISHSELLFRPILLLIYM